MWFRYTLIQYRTAASADQVLQTVTKQPVLLESYQCLAVLPPHSDILAAAVLTPPYRKSIHHNHCSYFFLICKHTIPKISTESYQNNFRQSIFYESNDITALFYIDVVYCRRKPLRHSAFLRNAPTVSLKCGENAYKPQGWKAPHCGALCPGRGGNALGPLSCAFIEQADSGSFSHRLGESGSKQRRCPSVIEMLTSPASPHTASCKGKQGVFQMKVLSLPSACVACC